MNNQFDELTKSMAQSVTRRAALKKFGVGIAGIALATLGLANKAEAKPPYSCKCNQAYWGCPHPDNDPQNNACGDYCYVKCSTRGGGGH